MAALYRDGEVPGFVHLSIGQEASAVGACWPLAPGRRHHVDPSRPRPLPGQGPRPARDVRRADGQGRGHQPRPRRLDAHRRSRRSGSSAPTASWPPACRSRSGAATAAQLRADGSVAVAFFGDGAVAQGAFHEAVNLAAVWQLPVVFFCENNGYAEFSPASTQHAAPLERRAAGYGVDYVAVDGNDVVATAAAMARRGRGRPRRARSRHRRGGDLPLARPLRRRPASATGRPTRSGSGRRATRCSSTRAGSASAGVGDDEIDALRVVGRATSSTKPSRRRGGSPRPAPATLTDFVVRAATRTRRAAAARPPTRRSSAPWTRSAPRSKPSSPTTSACSSPASTSAPAATSSGSRAGCTTGSATASATRRSPRPRSWASASARRWRACGRWSS